MAQYQSDYGQFLQEMRARHPEWAAEQREGLGLLWNRKVDFDEQQHLRGAAVEPKSYPYDVNF